MENLHIFADIGEKMELDTDCKHETKEFREHLFRKMWDQCKQCSKHFRTAPSKSTLKEGTAELKMDVTIPQADPFSIVKQCAIAILGPKTHFDEPYVLALLDLCFENKIGVLVTQRIETVYVISHYQPWISRDTVVAIAVLHENQSIEHQHFDIAELRDKILLLRESSPASLACGSAAQRDGSGASNASISAAAVGGSLGRTDGSTDAAANCEASVQSPVPSVSASSRKSTPSSSIKDYFTPTTNCKDSVQAGPRSPPEDPDDDTDRCSNGAAATTLPISGGAGSKPDRQSDASGAESKRGRGGKRGRQSGASGGSKPAGGSGSHPKSSRCLADCCEDPIARLHIVVTLLRSCPRQVGVESWFASNNKNAPTHRQLLACLHIQSRCRKDPALATRRLGQAEDRIAGILVASCASTTRGIFKAKFITWIEEHLLPEVPSDRLR